MPLRFRFQAMATKKNIPAPPAEEIDPDWPTKAAFDAIEAATQALIDDPTYVVILTPEERADLIREREEMPVKVLADFIGVEPRTLQLLAADGKIVGQFGHGRWRHRPTYLSYQAYKGTHLGPRVFAFGFPEACLNPKRRRCRNSGD